MRTVVLTSALSAAAAAVGSLGTTPDSEWCRSLDSDPGARGRLLALTTADLVVNASWNWAFFDRQSPRAGMAVIGVLNVLNGSNWRRNR